MKHVIWKVFYNYEKEEKWLNSMSAKGLSLEDYWWTRYVFRECDSDKYIYRIEMLEHRAKHLDSLAYIKFMEENGVEYVASYMKWVYFRKNANDGPFDIYSDLDSKILHYKRIRNWWLFLSIFELLCGLPAFIAGIEESVLSKTLSWDLFISFLPFAFGIMFLFGLAAPVNRKLKKLCQDKRLME